MLDAVNRNVTPGFERSAPHPYLVEVRTALERIQHTSVGIGPVKHEHFRTVKIEHQVQLFLYQCVPCCRREILVHLPTGYMVGWKSFAVQQVEGRHGGEENDLCVRLLSLYSLRKSIHPSEMAETNTVGWKQDDAVFLWRNVGNRSVAFT